MPKPIPTPSAVDLLVDPVDGRTASTFILRGQTYTRVSGGPTTFWADGSATMRVFPEGKTQRDIIVRPDARVQVLTYV